LELLNELEDPAENITNEIIEEAVDHQFFYSTSIDDLVIAYDDMDPNGNAIGLETMVSANSANTGTITIILRHEPKKSASGVADGTITNAGGETDIEVTFYVDIQ
jgi:hypothetical protein